MTEASEPTSSEMVSCGSYRRRMPDKRLVIVLVLLGVIAWNFWTGSRYPDLGVKSSMGMISDLKSMGLDVKWEGSLDDPAWLSIVKATVNWLHANRKGMTFGLLLAAGVMSALSLLPLHRLRNPFSNSLAGVLIGTTLGVCVNCATPIMRGMHAGGSRLELSLATMFASPVFNVMVIAMTFAFFPLHMAVTKLALSLMLVLVGVPMIVRWLKIPGQDDSGCGEAEGATAAAGKAAGPEPAGWLQAGLWTAKEFALNLWRVGYRTVPLMVLAGLLGAVMLHYLPVNWFERISPEKPTWFTTLAISAAVAVVGTLIPLPMAMDVLLAAALYAAGVPAHFAMTFLFTAGMYSVYPFMVIAKDVSRLLAVACFAAVCGFGVLAGTLAYQLEKGNLSSQERYFVQALQQSPETLPKPRPALPAAVPADELVPSLESAALAWNAEPSLSSAGITVASLPFRTGDTADGQGLVRHDGADYGLKIPYHNDTDKLMTFIGGMKRCIASGDVHGDGWPDLLISGDFGLGGVFLLANREGKGFDFQELDLGALAESAITDLALVDLDNDGALDLYFSTFREGVYVWPNRGGKFLPGDLRRIHHHPLATVAASGFGDLNRDGYLDIVLGHWTYSWSVAFQEGAPESSRNVVLWGGPDGSFREEILPGEPGETLSILISDVNADGYPDIIEANDFDEPDHVYLGGPDGKLRLLTGQDRFIRESTTFTMSVDTADLDNDLRPEILLANIAIGGVNRQRKDSIRAQDVWKTLPDPALQEEHARYMNEIAQLLPWQSPASWKHMADERLRQNSVAAHVFGACRLRGKMDWLDYLPAHRPDLREIAVRAKVELYQPTPMERFQEIPQRMQRNILLTPGTSGYADVTKDWGIEFTGWTWNARFADLNQDTWQDLFLVNGFLYTRRRESNRLYLNESGRTFRDETAAQGMTDFLETSCYTYLDFDWDGDPDIVYVPMTGPIQVCENRFPRRHAIRFQLRDETGLRDGIGSRIIVIAGPEGVRRQIREIKASGGYASCDAPEAHFGLGDDASVSQVVVLWPDGEKTVLAGPFPADRCYRLTRRQP